MKIKIIFVSYFLSSIENNLMELESEINDFIINNPIKIIDVVIREYKHDYVYAYIKYEEIEKNDNI